MILQFSSGFEIFCLIRENKEKQIKINRDYILKFVKFLRTTVECHDTKAKNAGTQLLFGTQLYGTQLLLDSTKLFDQKKRCFLTIHDNQKVIF